MKPTIPRLFAHRGCSGSAPENTLAAFQLAVDRGIPAVELDVQFTLSGEVVVIHDTNLKRLAGIDIDVDQIHWSELKSVDVGSWYDPSHASERIPLLETVFETFGDRLFYDIELKTRQKRDDRLPLAVAELIERFNLADRCLISSFNPLAVRAMARIRRPVVESGGSSRYVTSIIYSKHAGVPALLRRGAGCALTRCNVAKPHWKQAGRFAVMWHHLNGRRISAWTVNDREVARKLFENGVDAVISDVPETLVDLVPSSSTDA